MEVLLSLVSGLAIAVTVQLLLTNLGIALGLTVLDWSPSQVVEPVDEPPSEEAASTSHRSLPVTHLVGFGVALTLSGVLFTAALLATEFSQLAEPRRGAIFGLILWSAYWLLFIWLSSTTLSNLANSVLGTAIAGGRRLFNTLRQALRSPKVDAPVDEMTVLRQLTAELSQVKELREQLPTLLDQQRETLIQEICDRTDLSPQQAEAVVDDMASQTAPASPSSALSPQSSGLLPQLDLPNWQQVLQQALDQVDLSDWDAETLWHQAQSLLASDSTADDDSVQDSPDQDDSHPEDSQQEDDHQNGSARNGFEQNGSHQVKATDNGELAVLQDAKEYVQHSPTWALKPAVIKREFYQRLHDPAADPAAIQTQVSQLDHADYVDWLRQRGDMAADQVTAIADHLSQVQQTVMTAITETSATTDAEQVTAEIAAAWPDFEKKLLAYLRYTNLDLLTADSLTQKIQAMRTEAALESSALRVPPTHLTPLTAVLSRRKGLASAQQAALVEVLQTQLAARDSAPQARDRLAELRHIFQKTLDAVDWSAISLEDLKPELQDQMRSLDLRGEIDWQSLVGKLQVPDETRGDLIDWLQETGQHLTHQPRRWAQRVGQSTQTWAQQLSQDVTHYLQFQDKAALQPTHIAKDLKHLLQKGLRTLPSPSDWPDIADVKNLLDLSTVKTALENRRDLTVSEIQQISGWLEDAWEHVIQQMNDWSTTLWHLTRDRLTAQVDNLDAVRAQVVERIADTQAAVQAQAAELKADLQRQADAARRQVAIAAWWLFLSLLSSGGAAAIAGWLAVRY